MFSTVSFNCEKCGNKQMVVTRESSDRTIEGYYSTCGQEVSGFYVAVTEPTTHATAT